MANIQHLLFFVESIQEGGLEFVSKRSLLPHYLAIDIKCGVWTSHSIIKWRRRYNMEKKKKFKMQRNTLGIYALQTFS